LIWLEAEIKEHVAEDLSTTEAAAVQATEEHLDNHEKRNRITKWL